MSDVQDTSPSVADIMARHESPARVVGKYRPMRGQAYVLIDRIKSSLILMPDEDPREEKVHRGRVLALGPPAFLDSSGGSPEVPWDVSVGDEVCFVLAVWLDRMRMLEMFGVKGTVCVVAQGEIVGKHE